MMGSSIAFAGVSLSSFNNVYAVGAVWIALAFVASLISIRAGLSVALVEILVGVFGGNVLHISPNEWINFVAGFGSVLLTFLAGAEIDPKSRVGLSSRVS